jgi:hypothetical protein
MVNRAGVALQYQGLWDGLVKLVPFWNDVLEVVDRELGTQTGGFTPGALGVAHNATAGSRISEFPNRGISFTQGTVLVVFDGTGTPAGFGKLIASNPDGQFQFYRNNSDTSLVFNYGGQAPNFTVPNLWGTGPHVLVATYDTFANRKEVWADGVSAGVDNASLTPISSWTNPDIGIGNRKESLNRTAGGLMFLVAFWDRVLSPAEVRLLAQDPFGLIRPAPWPVFPARPSGLIVSLYATGDGTITDVVNELDAASPLWSSIDDDPDSPDDDDWVNNAITPGTVRFYPLLTDMPAGFGTADSATIVGRVRGQNFGVGSLTLHVQLYQSDESTPLSDEVEVVTVSANSSFDNTIPITITGIVAGTKAIWNSARARFRWV